MIHFFTGKPGNGKSLHMAEIMYKALKKGRNVISNFEINESYFDGCSPEKLGRFIYVCNHYWLNNAYLAGGGRKFSYIEGLKNFAFMYHERGADGQIREGQTLLVLDECQEIFNNRQWNRADRLEWCAFLREHRKYGYEVYLISQDDKVIDKQIRQILQFEFEHRALKNYKLFGRLLSLLFGGNLFVCIKRNYSMKGKDARVGSFYFRGKKKFYGFYDSYALFHG